MEENRVGQEKVKRCEGEKKRLLKRERPNSE